MHPFNLTFRNAFVFRNIFAEIEGPQPVKILVNNMQPYKDESEKTDILDKQNEKQDETQNITNDQLNEIRQKIDKLFYRRYRIKYSIRERNPQYDWDKHFLQNIISVKQKTLYNH